MAIATFRTFLGVAKEVTPGTPVAATDFVAITADPKSKDNYRKLDDKSFRGSAVATYAKIPAMRTGELGVDGNVIPATIGYMLGSLLPDVVTTAVAAPTGLALGTPASGGTFAAGTYYWKVTALTGTGETTGSNEVTTALTLNQQVMLTWNTVPGASGYRVYRGTSAGSENALIATVGPVGTYTDTGTAGSAATVPGSSTAATNGHAFSLKNTSDGQPTSLTFSDYDGDATRAFAGAKFSELTLKFSADGLLTFTSKASTWASAVVTTPTPSYSTVLPIAAYTGVLSVGGVKQVNVQSAELSLKRKVEYLQTVQGIQDPYALFSGPLAVTGKLTTVLLASDPMLAAIGNSSSPGLVFTMAFTQGATSLVVQMSDVVYDGVDVQRSKDYVELSVGFEAIGNVSDVGASAGYSPVKVFLGNNVASGTYQ